ncbi:T-cell surface protein tactile [Lepisosteus oculatus]|uniref:T-cell surface protein tactile n=1 Tax=Lepisosteus oculatus TaxID=7918 RepID=UPI00371F2513
MALTAFLFFAVITEGLDGYHMENNLVFSVTVGQNVSIPCVMEEEKNLNIAQIEWKKAERGKENKIVVYNPSFGTIYMNKNATFEPLRKGNPSTLYGSLLHLYNINSSDMGQFVCELTTFPLGSIKIIINLIITEPVFKLSINVTWPKRSIKEGDDVNVHCESNIPVEQYSLWPLNNKTSIYKSKDGLFILRNVKRDESGLYFCKPEWLHSDPFKDKNITVYIQVHYLDKIECDIQSPIEADLGTNLKIDCHSEASQPPEYIWKKDNMTVSRSRILQIENVTSEMTGVYKLTATIKDVVLERQKEFYITLTKGTVIPSITFTTASPGITPNISQTGGTDMYTDVTASTQVAWTSDSPGQVTNISRTTMTEQERDTTSSVNATHGQGYSTHHSASTSWQNSSMSYNEENSTDFATKGKVSYPVPATLKYNITSFTQTPWGFNTSVVIDTGATGGKEGHTTVVFIILPCLVCLILIVVLVRRYIQQKKLDEPPSFKPPPPPTKYKTIETQEMVEINFKDNAIK